MQTVGKLMNLYLLMIHGQLLLTVPAECWGCCWSSFGAVGGARPKQIAFLWLLGQAESEWQLLKLAIMEGQDPRR